MDSQPLSAFAVSSECGSATHNWHQPMRPHHTSVYCWENSTGYQFNSASSSN